MLKQTYHVRTVITLIIQAGILTFRDDRMGPKSGTISVQTQAVVFPYFQSLCYSDQLMQFFCLIILILDQQSLADSVRILKYSNHALLLSIFYDVLIS